MTELDTGLVRDIEDEIDDFNYALDTIEEAFERRLTKDEKAIARLLPRQEVRYLVNHYYDLQKSRVISNNQIKAMARQELPVSELLVGIRNGLEAMEGKLKSVMKEWAENGPYAEDTNWLLSIVGIGPVISAGLVAHIDIERSNTAGKLWSFAGLNPDMVWEKGQKRPYNANLKVLTAYKAGESFVKVSGKPNSLYGKLYRQYKDRYESRNDDGTYADQAAAVLKGPRAPRKTTEAYKALSAGRLPQAQIHARARRAAVKIFLSHLQQQMWRSRFHELPPKPWVIEHGGHANMIEPEVPFTWQPVPL